MAAKTGSFDFCKALSGISTKDDHVETATSDIESDDTLGWENFNRENFDLDVYMDCEEHDRMSCKAQKLFSKLDGKRRASAVTNDDKDSPSKEIQGTSTSSKEGKTDFGEWQLPSQCDLFWSRKEKLQSLKKCTYRWSFEAKAAFRCLPASVLVELEKDVVEYRQKYMEMCTEQYSELYKPTEDCPYVTVETMLQYLVEHLVLWRQDEDWDDKFGDKIAEEIAESLWLTELHCIRALAVHFNVCTRNQAENVVALLNLHFMEENTFTDELFQVIEYWITDPTFGPTLAEVIGEVVLKAGVYIYEYLIESIAEYICPQQKTLVKYKKVRDILVFYLCAELGKSSVECDMFDIINCLVKLDGHESWAIVEDVFITGKYDHDIDGYTYAEYLEDLNLGLPDDVNALRKARHEQLSQSDEFSQKFWKKYDEHCLKLEKRHVENSSDPSYRNMQRCKKEDANRMALQVYEFLQKYLEAGKSKRKGKCNGMSASMIEACKKCQEEERNGKVPDNNQLKDPKEKKSESTNSAKKPDTSVTNGSKAPGPGKVPLNFKTYKIRECGFCGKLSTPELKFSKCASCLHVYYCSRGCQKQHWKAGHKNQCNKK